MKRSFRVVILILAFIGMSLVSYGKEWRGISPLHSTRTDVEKLLGPPQPPPKDWFYVMQKGFSMYFLDEGIVRIDFAEQETPAAETCLDKVSAGTVLLITVIPKGKRKVTDVQEELSRFEKFNPSIGKDPEYQAYYDQASGIIISTHSGNVEAICYLAPSAEKRLCRSYYRNPKAFVEVRVEW
jgi:hypothetical protein